jgi:hypothetical protein
MTQRVSIAGGGTNAGERLGKIGHEFRADDR